MAARFQRVSQNRLRLSGRRSCLRAQATALPSPAVPELRAGSSTEISTTTTSGCLFRITRAAATPLIPGMTTSIKTSRGES